MMSILKSITRYLKSHKILFVCLLVVIALFIVQHLKNLKKWPKTIRCDDGVDCLCFSADSKILASGGDRRVTLWSTETRKILKKLQHKAYVQSIAISSDGKFLVSGGDGQAKLWSLKTGEIIAQFSGGYQFTSVAISPDNKILAIGSATCTGDILELVSMETRKTITRRSGYCYPVFSTDGKFIAVFQSEGVITLFFSETCEEMKIFSGPTNFGSITVSPDGKIVACGSREDVKLWSTESGQVISTLSPPYSNRYCSNPIAFSPDGRLLASGGNKITLWNVKDGKIITILSVSANSICFSPDGNLLASGGNHKIRIWNLQSILSDKTTED